MQYYHDLETEREDRREARKWKALKAAVVKAEACNPEFAGRLASIGATAKDINSYEDFAKIPTITRRRWREFQVEHGIMELAACDDDALSRIFPIPGPAWAPQCDTPDFWALSEALWAAEFRPGDMALNTFSYHLNPAGFMMEEALRNIGCPVIPAGPGNLDNRIAILRSLPIKNFIGLASFLKEIADRASQLGLNTQECFPLRQAFVSAAHLPESLRRELEERLDISLTQAYGTADVGCIAYECPEHRGMHISSSRLVEICSPESGKPLKSGKTGEVVVSTFNLEYPVLRFATGDLSRCMSEHCQCGRTSIRLRGVLGRVDEATKVKGEFLYPDQAASIIESFPNAGGWQFRINDRSGRETLVLLVESEHEEFMLQLGENLQAHLRLRFQLERIRPGTLPPEAPRIVDERNFTD